MRPPKRDSIYIIIQNTKICYILSQIIYPVRYWKGRLASSELIFDTEDAASLRPRASNWYSSRLILMRWWIVAAARGMKLLLRHHTSHTYYHWRAAMRINTRGSDCTLLLSRYADSFLISYQGFRARIPLPSYGQYGTRQETNFRRRLAFY